MTCVKCRQTTYKLVRPQGFTLLDLMVALLVVGLLATLAVPAYSGVVERARVAAAIGDMGKIQIALDTFITNNNGLYPASLAAVGWDTRADPWGNPYQYLNIEVGANPGAVRKDRNLVPINTDFDLYSMGKDGDSVPPLTANASLDDVIRANNGAYFGLAEDY